MEWKNIIKDGYPDSNKRILIYSDIYKDEIRMFRIIDSQFINICNETTHWSYLEKPK